MLADFTIDLDGLAELAERVRPKLITMGASLNLLPHPVKEVRDHRRHRGRGRAVRCRARLRNVRRQVSGRTRSISART